MEVSEERVSLKKRRNRKGKSEKEGKRIGDWGEGKKKTSFLLPLFPLSFPSTKTKTK